MGQEASVCPESAVPNYSIVRGRTAGQMAVVVVAGHALRGISVSSSFVLILQSAMMATR